MVVLRYYLTTWLPNGHTSKLQILHYFQYLVIYVYLFSSIYAGKSEDRIDENIADTFLSKTICSHEFSCKGTKTILSQQ